MRFIFRNHSQGYNSQGYNNRGITKKPFYSNKPVLLADGEMDNACRPIYIDMIHHYMPNSQRVLSTDRGHIVGGKELEPLIQLFLEDPYRKLFSSDTHLILY